MTTETTELKEYRLYIDGHPVDIDAVYHGGYLPTICDGSQCWYVAKDAESAGEAVSEYYRDMARNDKREFACLIGDERLIQWALGESDSFGISSLEEFLDRVADYPEEHWGSWDGSELEVTHDELPAKNQEVDLTEAQLEQVQELRTLFEDIGFIPTAAYRW